MESKYININQRTHLKNIANCMSGILVEEDFNEIVQVYDKAMIRAAERRVSVIEKNATTEENITDVEIRLVRDNANQYIEGKLTVDQLQGISKILKIEWEY